MFLRIGLVSTKAGAAVKHSMYLKKKISVVCSWADGKDHLFIKMMVRGICIISLFNHTLDYICR